MQPDLRRRSAGLAVLVAAVLLLAACGDDGGTKTKAGSATTAGNGATTTTTEAAPAAAAPVATTSNPTLGQIVVDSKGLTVYVFDADKDGKIACLDACTTAWPPVVLEGGASLPTTGTLGADLSTVARPDGTKQVAYKGRPLYRFASDAKAGDTNGDGKGGVWHAVKIAAAGGATTTTVVRASPVSPY